MFFAIDDQQQRGAKSPHELTMINLLLFNLLIGVALLGGSMARPDSIIAAYKWVGIAVPLLLSLSLILFTWLREARARRTEPWFVAAHWKLSARRNRSLLAAYLISAAVVSLAFFGGGDDRELERRIAELPPAMQEMERHKLESQDMGSAIWARIGVVPLLLTVMALIMLESGALFQAGRGEVPDAIIARFPPPQELEGSAEPIANDG
ncbi:MAG: hypothetical protein WBG92_07885 [Thiohalocapsa sp.]